MMTSLPLVEDFRPKNQKENIGGRQLQKVRLQKDTYNLQVAILATLDKYEVL